MFSFLTAKTESSSFLLNLQDKNMTLISHKTEFWVQGYYGYKWQDLEEVTNIVEAAKRIVFLREKRPTGEFRLIERTIQERVFSDKLD